MPKLTKKAIRYGRTDGRTDPNYRKASLLKRIFSNPHKKITGCLFNRGELQRPPPKPIKVQKGYRPFRVKHRVNSLLKLKL